MRKKFSSGLHGAGATTSMDSADAEGSSPPAAAAPMIALVAETESFLLLISSIGAAEPLREAAVHHPRACAAARRVVDVLQASLFGASDRLLVLLRWSVAALGVLERCVTRVSAVTRTAIGVHWSGMVPVPHAAPLTTAVERPGARTYTLTEKREILRSPGLQNVWYSTFVCARGSPHRSRVSVVSRVTCVRCRSRWCALSRL